METKLKIGIMGLRRGAFVLRSAKLLRDDILITAVCETDAEQVEKERENFMPETKAYTDFDEFINSGLDAVVLCNYFHEHAKYAIKALDAGVAVLSEITAAPTLGECVDLVEAVERNNGKYMLAANCLYFKPVHAMKEKIASGEYGPVLYAEAEYIHSSNGGGLETLNAIKEIDTDNLHWRQTMPSCYYNMHTLGPLMYITQSVPKKVVAKAAVVSDNGQKLSDTPKSFAITEMDNGAVFNTTGCVNYGPTSKWYRVACKEGTLETERYDWREEWLIEAKRPDEFKRSCPSWSASGAISPGEEKKYKNFDAVGHGGIDFIMMVHFLKYLRGEEECFLNVYRSAALSAAGILSWYSILENSREYEIPDFKDKKAREVFRGDYRLPIAKSYKDLTLPCRLSELKLD